MIYRTVSSLATICLLLICLFVRTLPVIGQEQQLAVGVQINSVALDDDQITINLTLTNAQRIGRLFVKIENRNTGLLAQQFGTAVQNQITFDGSELTIGETYNITILAQSAAGNTITNTVQDSRGQPVQEEAMAVTEFAYAPEFRGVSLLIRSFQREIDVNGLPQYIVTFNPVEADNIAFYSVMFEDLQSGLTLNDTLSYQAPMMNNQLIIPMGNIPSGDYRILIDAEDVDGTIIGRVTREVNHDRPRINFFRTARNNYWITGIVIAIILVLVILLVRSIVGSGGRRKSVSTIDMLYRSSSSVLSDDDLSLATLDIARKQKLNRELEKRKLPPAWIMIGNKKIPVSRTPFVIGRDDMSQVDLPLGQPGVSREHVRITFNNHTFYIEDLKSTNGTRLNKKKITGNIKLRSGDVIAAGPNVEMTFYHQ